jgi:hypothetical protein
VTNDTAAVLVTAMGQLTAAVDALRADLAAARPMRTDDAAAVALLREIVHVLGDHVFCTVDLLQRVPSPDDERLRAAIVAACGSLSPRRIGKLLRRYEGRDVERMRVVRTGRVEREGAVWQIVCLRV